MAFQCFLSLILLLFLASSSIISGKSTPPSSPSFDFIKELGGCKKGNKSEGIQRLRHYLKEFGYLPKAQTLNSDYFDNALESAIKIYQRNFQLKPSGTLDSTTLSTMMAPRCGVPDIVNGTNYMQPHKNWSSSSTSYHTVSHYSFFGRRQKWPKRQLSYRFLSGFPSYAMPPVRRAFRKWSTATWQDFKFSEVETSDGSDMSIGFYRGAHGDSEAFDGRGGILAHAYAPTDGSFHYDADELWSVGPKFYFFDLETVALHEIGHLLGLQHSEFEEAIMFPGIPSGKTKNIQYDDIRGIKALYNLY